MEEFEEKQCALIAEYYPFDLMYVTSAYLKNGMSFDKTVEHLTYFMVNNKEP